MDGQLLSLSSFSFPAEKGVAKYIVHMELVK